MTAIFEKISQEFKHIKFASIDIEKEPDMATTLEIQTIPSFIFFKPNTPIKGFAGTKSYEELKKMIVEWSK